MSAEDVKWLIADGWIESRNQSKRYARCFYKRFETPTRCRCNDDKDGMQVEISVTGFMGKESCEIELCGELSDGTWILVNNYRLPTDIEKVVALIPRLLAVWEASNR